MSRFRCRACQGEFDSVQPDGMEYYHACAPKSAWEPGPPGERPNRRDENVALDDRGRRVGIRREGSGRDPI